jgi:hypothetical protein
MELGTYAKPESLFGLSLTLGQVRDPIITEPIVARLESCHRSQEWLVDIAVNLQQLIVNGTSEAIQRGEQLCQFLSWICAPLKGNSSWSILNDVAYKHSSDFFAKQSRDRQPNLQLLCWVVTHPFDKTEINHPVLMPFQNIDSDLVLGYRNLLEHINGHVWDTEGLEVDTTSLTLRLAGIVNALNRDADLAPALAQQVRGLKGMISDADYKIYSDSWIKDFVDIRNAIAHVSDRGLGFSLEQAWERSRDLSQIRSIIRLGSYLMANEVRKNFLEFPAEHASSWAERFEEELGWYQ